MARSRRLMITLWLPLLLSGCMLTAAEPLAPQAQAVRDEGLLGEWREVRNPTTRLLVESRDTHTIRITYSSPDFQMPLIWEGHITAVGGWNVANLRNPPLQGTREGITWPPYTLIPYVIMKGKLHAWILPGLDWEKMIKDGTLRGYVPRERGGFLFLDDTPERMRAALLKLQQRPYWDPPTDFERAPAAVGR